MILPLVVHWLSSLVLFFPIQSYLNRMLVLFVLLRIVLVTPYLCQAIYLIAYFLIFHITFHFSLVHRAVVLRSLLLVCVLVFEIRIQSSLLFVVYELVFEGRCVVGEEVKIKFVIFCFI